MFQGILVTETWSPCLSRSRAHSAFLSDLRKMEREVTSTAQQEADAANNKNIDAVNDQRQESAAACGVPKSVSVPSAFYRRAVIQGRFI